MRELCRLRCFCSFVSVDVYTGADRCFCVGLLLLKLLFPWDVLESRGMV
jgi:hypothetical protein